MNLKLEIVKNDHRVPRVLGGSRKRRRGSESFLHPVRFTSLREPLVPLEAGWCRSKPTRALRSDARPNPPTTRANVPVLVPNPMPTIAALVVDLVAADLIVGGHG